MLASPIKAITKATTLMTTSQRIMFLSRSDMPFIGFLGLTDRYLFFLSRYMASHPIFVFSGII